jgi:ribonuclease HI
LHGPNINAHEVHFLGPKLHTNNYAEYQGLIRLLKFLYKARLRNVVIYCDSLLVVNQVNDVWDVNSPDLLPYWQLAYGMVMQGCHVLKHIKGHDGIAGNEEADRLCNEVLDGYFINLHVEEHKALLKEENDKTMGSNNKQTQS